MKHVAPNNELQREAWRSRESGQRPALPTGAANNDVERRKPVVKKEPPTASEPFSDLFAPVEFAVKRAVAGETERSIKADE